MRVYFIIILSLTLGSCGKPLPKEKFSQAKLGFKSTLTEDSVVIHADNTLYSPARYYLKSNDSLLKALFEGINPLLLEAREDTSLTLFAPPEMHMDTSKDIWYSWVFGDPNDSLRLSPLSLPFLPNREFSIVQGYNGQYSHQGNYSRYALDFGMQVGDTICAADKGYAVGVIEGYEFGGNNRKWRDYANYITLFHPHSNLFTQYVHLTHEGAFIEVGDEVQMGQPIGLSGMTGWTDIPHLHFNAIYPKEEEFFGSPVEFLEGYKGKDLKRNGRVKKGSEQLFPKGPMKGYLTFEEAILGLRILSYELKSFEALSKEDNFLNKRIAYLNSLREGTDKPIIPLIPDGGISAVFRAQVKSTQDRGGNLFNRATIESWLCINEGEAKGLTKQIDALQDRVSWMHISKSPITYWQQGKEVRFITPGGFYMLEDVPEIQAFLQEYTGKEGGI